MNEKRRRQRVPFVSGCRLKTGASFFKISELRDLSMEGLAVFTDWPAEVGALAELELNLVIGRQRKSVKAECRVCRLFEEDGKPGIGLSIRTIGDADSITLFNIVKYQTGSVYKLLGESDG